MVTQIQTRVLDPRIGTEWPAPGYATDGAAAIDLRAMLDTPLLLTPNATALIKSGMAINIQDPSIAGLIYPRSGLGYKYGIVLANGTGVIDSDYQGELLVPLWNRGDEVYQINPGDRIAQLVFTHIVRFKPLLVETFSRSTRGSGGFGSTGNG